MTSAIRLHWSRATWLISCRLLRVRSTKDYASLPAGSKNLFSLAALYDANEELLGSFNANEVPRNELSRIAVDFWTVVAAYIPDWMRVKDGKMLAREFRQESISSHSVVLRALGGAGAELDVERSYWLA